jgi:hypothetical protein
MVISPHLLVSMPHVEELAGFFLVLWPPPIPLTSPEQYIGLAPIAVLDLDIRCFDATDDTALGHD